MLFNDPNKLDWLHMSGSSCVRMKCAKRYLKSWDDNALVRLPGW